jgi:hypothetical protein
MNRRSSLMALVDTLLDQPPEGPKTSVVVYNQLVTRLKAQNGLEQEQAELETQRVFAMPLLEVLNSFKVEDLLNAVLGLRDKADKE